MQTLMTILTMIGAGLILWMLYQSIVRNPGAFTADKLNKSFFTLGLLALFLIGFIALLVVFLKTH